MNDERQKLSTVTCTCTYVPVVQGLVGGRWSAPLRIYETRYFRLLVQLHYDTVFFDSLSNFNTCFFIMILIDVVH
jgi:hypothetical protein